MHYRKEHRDWIPRKAASTGNIWFSKYPSSKFHRSTLLGDQAISWHDNIFQLPKLQKRLSTGILTDPSAGKNKTWFKRHDMLYVLSKCFCVYLKIINLKKIKEHNRHGHVLISLEFFSLQKKNTISFIIISVGPILWWMRNTSRNLRYMTSKESANKFLAITCDSSWYKWRKKYCSYNAKVREQIHYIPEVVHMSVHPGEDFSVWATIFIIAALLIERYQILHFKMLYKFNQVQRF